MEHNMKDKTKSIIIRAPEDLWRKVAQASVDRMISRNAIILEALEKYFENKK